jgi:hypothetical protein
MQQLLASIIEQIRLSSLIDVGITAVLIYWLFILIRGTRAVSLVIGVTVLFAVYAAARFFGLPDPPNGCRRRAVRARRRLPA